MGQSLSPVTRHPDWCACSSVGCDGRRHGGRSGCCRILHARPPGGWNHTGGHMRPQHLLVYRRVLGGRRIGWGPEIVSVDCSAPIVARSEQNFRANGLDPDAHDFLVLDVEAFDRLRRTGRRFRVVVDPPRFPEDGETFSMKKGYPRLVAAAAGCSRMRWLILASNHGGTSLHQFQGYCRGDAKGRLLRSTCTLGHRAQTVRPRRRSQRGST